MKSNRAPKSNLTGFRVILQSAFLVAILASVLTKIESSGAQAASTISTDADCGTCLSAADSYVCRATTYDRVAYCCAEAELGSRACGGTTAFCSSDSLNPVIDNFACAYSSGYCGASTSEILMHPTTRNNLRVEISNYLYVDEETCYYVFTMDD